MSKTQISLGDAPIGRLLFNYSLPAIIATTASSFYNIIDRMFIGHGVGPYAISGLAITFPIMNLAVAFGTLVGAGAAAIVSIRMGEKRIQDAAHTLGNAFLLNLIIGILFSLIAFLFLDDLLILFGASEKTLPYSRDFMQVILAGNVITHLFFGLNSIMRASGYPTKAMISILLTVAVNLVLAPLFIFVFEWGIRGAAFATVISQFIGLIWIMAHFTSHTSIIRFTPNSFKLSGTIVFDIFAIGLSPFIIHSCSCLISILMNLQLKKYGGDFSIGAFGIINSVNGVIVMIIFGLTQGMQPIVGYNYGAALMSRVTKTLKMSIYSATTISVIGFILILLFPTAIAKCFTNNQELIDIVVHGIRIYMFALPVIGFQIVASNYFQAIGKAKLSILLSLSRQVVCLIPFLLMLPSVFQLDGVWLSAPVADFLASLFTAIVLFIYAKKYHKMNTSSLYINS